MAALHHLCAQGPRSNLLLPVLATAPPKLPGPPVAACLSREASHLGAMPDSLPGLTPCVLRWARWPQRRHWNPYPPTLHRRQQPPPLPPRQAGSVQLTPGWHEPLPARPLCHAEYMETLLDGFARPQTTHHCCHRLRSASAQVAAAGHADPRRRTVEACTHCCRSRPQGAASALSAAVSSVPRPCPGLSLGHSRRDSFRQGKSR
mmetsp:Transcript_118762/g.331333  ORF Transcript_118762/g.331333 Transcript_118762/m.331333 type:complete len:204 (+) Transcript_118762:637-1248(+)